MAMVGPRSAGSAAFSAAAAFKAALSGLGASSGTTSSSPLVDMADGPYLVLAHWLDEATLCSTDAACQRLLAMNSSEIGPWRSMGARAFHGLELQEDGLFEPDEGAPAGGKKRTRIFWKGRFQHFRSHLSMFCPPFEGSEITLVDQPDEVSYFQCHLCTDILDKSPMGVYLEVEVLENPDNLSMAIVDFEAGGCSSLTFSPDTGAVIREQKVRESPRKVEGAYIQPLPTLPPGDRFQGLLGFFLQKGRMAFFRRFSGGSAAGPSRDTQAGAAEVGTRAGGADAAAAAMPGNNAHVLGEGVEEVEEESQAAKAGLWETTGFISDLAWATGRWLTPCLAFRSEGAYQVRITQIGGPPPLHLEAPSAQALRELGWNSLDWEADPNNGEALED
jgi:hypothetical protein